MNTQLQDVIYMVRRNVNIL